VPVALRAGKTKKEEIMNHMDRNDFNKFMETLHSAIAAAPTSKEALLFQRDLVVFELMGACCLRSSEVLNLDIESVVTTETETALLVPRNRGRNPLSRPRSIPLLCPYALRHLRGYLTEVRPRLAGAKETHALFLSERGGRMTYSTLLQRFKITLKMAGLGKGYTTHMLRRAVLASILHTVPVESHAEGCKCRVGEWLNREYLKSLVHRRPRSFELAAKYVLPCHLNPNVDETSL
jgi:site-specific recombinase XerD